MAGLDVNVELLGLREWVAAVDAMVQRVIVATPDPVNKVLRTVARQERLLLDLGSHPPGTRTGSPPGSPPWRITGALRDAVTVERASRHVGYVWEGRVGPARRVIYGRIQELGGRAGRGHRATLPARPHLYPAWRMVRPTMHNEFVRAWGDAISRA